MIHLLGFALLSGLLVTSVVPEDLEIIPPPPGLPSTRCWTEWFDRDDPTGSGDWEILSRLRIENPGKICPDPVEIEVTTTNGERLPTGDIISKIDTITGFVCKNQDQRPYPRLCLDYRVRFSCPPPFCASSGVCWTKWLNRDTPGMSGDWESLASLRRENPGVICPEPLYIESVVAATNLPAGGENYLQCRTWHTNQKSIPESKLCDIPGCRTWHTNQDRSFLIISYNPTKGFVCLNKDQADGRCLDYKVRFGCPCC